MSSCAGSSEHVDAALSPQRILDFGCGVGRVVIPFAQIAADVVGMDVSPSMLAEARSNCTAGGTTNVTLLRSDDILSTVEGTFDLVHSCIVLQHIEVPRGTALFAQLVRRIRPGGVGASRHVWVDHLCRDLRTAGGARAAAAADAGSIAEEVD